MSGEVSPEDQAYFDEQDRHRRKFFELIGHCITSYQSVEDYLSEVFAEALQGEVGRAAAIFTVARGLEAKLNLISAAIIGREGHISKFWPPLLKRIASAAKARNEIAHSTPAHTGETITIVIDQETNQTLSVERTETGQMELRKQAKASETVRTLDQLWADYNQTEKIFTNLVGFAKLLKSEEAAPHLLDGLTVEAHD